MAIRWRLTVFNAMVMAAILTAFGVSVFFLVRSALLSGVEHAVRDRAEGVARTLETGQSLSASDVERLTLEGVFLIVRDGEGRVLARTVGSATDVGDPLWREALESGEPAGGQAAVSRSERGYVYAVPVEPPDLRALSRVPYFYEALAVPPEQRESDATRTIFGEAARIPFPSDARVVEVGKSYESAGATVATFAALLAGAIAAAFVVTAGGAYLLARAALSPVDAVVVSARGITAGDLSKRLPVERPKDEVGRLAVTINDLLSRLEAAFVRREEALLAQRRFVADASHQLRTPLTSIEGYARMLRAWGLEDPGTAREGAEAIHRESRHMRKLVEDLLSLARGDEGAPLEPVVHDLETLAEEAAASASISTRGRPAVSHARADGPVLARFDRERVEHAVAILLDNAVKYTAEGGEVTVAAAKRNGWVELEVSDNGKGIPEEDLPRVFDRFYRAEAARTARGAGLGLSIARQIAESHGGKLLVKSEVGKGSTFTLRLPADGPSDRRDPSN